MVVFTSCPSWSDDDDYDGGDKTKLYNFYSMLSIEYWWQNDDVDVDGDVNDGDDQDCDQPAGGELVFARSTCTWQQV